MLLVEGLGTKYLLIFWLTSLLSYYTLKNKIRISMLISVIIMYRFTDYYTVNNYFNVSMCKTMAKFRLMHVILGNSQGGFTANVKLHF